MPHYKAPLRDMRFLLHEVFDIESHYRDNGFDEVTADLIDAVLQEGAKFCEEVAQLQPHQRPGRFIRTGFCIERRENNLCPEELGN